MTSKKTPSPAKQAQFLRAYVTTGAISSAAEAANVARSRHYAWLADDPDYPAKFEQATEELIERLEAAVTESATVGVAEPVVYQGQVQYEPKRNKDGSFKVNEAGQLMYTDRPVTVRKRSDVAAFFLLKAKRPDVYRENSRIEHTGKGGTPLEVTVTFVKPE